MHERTFNVRCLGKSDTVPEATPNNPTLIGSNSTQHNGTHTNQTGCAVYIDSTGVILKET